MNEDLKPHETRVIEEKAELDSKLAKLKTFCFGPDNGVFRSLNPIDRDLLEDQYTVMEQYTIILSKRIERFRK